MTVGGFFERLFNVGGKLGKLKKGGIMGEKTMLGHCPARVGEKMEDQREFRRALKDPKSNMGIGDKPAPKKKKRKEFQDEGIRLAQFG
ncbi:MAG: hypothetical protein WCZ08_03960 [Parcubacteria group bacterium]|nr:hypothetical protein [Candidatus Moranbacteria bacterium]